MAVSQRDSSAAHELEPEPEALPAPAPTPTPTTPRPTTARGPHLAKARDRALDVVMSRVRALDTRDRPSVLQGTTGTRPERTASNAAARATKRAAVLAELRRCPILGHASRAAGVNPSTVTRWRSEDPAFDLEVVAALEEGVDRLEAETYSQALDVATKGNPTHLLKMFVLKSRRRDVYGERLEVNTTARHEIVINLVPAGQLPAGQPVTIIDGALELEPGPGARPLPSGELEHEHRPGQAARPGSYPPPDGGHSLLHDQVDHDQELEP